MSEKLFFFEHLQVAFGAVTYLITGAAIPMPPELMELYNLYKQELETRNKKENQFVEELNNEIIRVSFNYFVNYLKWVFISSLLSRRRVCCR